MNDSVFLSLNGLTYYDERLKEHIRSSFGSTMTVEWEPIENGKNPFKLKIALKNGHGTELFSKIVDFPLEQTIVSGEYEDSIRSLVLYFRDGTSTEIPIGDLIVGLASKLDLEGKADLGRSLTITSDKGSVSVPYGVAPYAKISVIGGSCEGGAAVKVTSVKSIGRNRLCQEKILEQSGVTLNEERYYCGHARYLAQGINKTRTIPNGGYKLNTQYTVGYKCYAELKANGTQFGIEYTDGTIEYTGTINSTEVREIVFTTKPNKTVFSIWATYGADNTCYIKDLYMYEGAYAEYSYTPYRQSALNIPQSVINLLEYGQGDPNDKGVYNYLDASKGSLISRGCLSEGNWVSYESEKETPVSEFCNIIPVEEGGTVTLENEGGYEVPGELIFFEGNNGILTSSTVVGNLFGMSSYSKYFEQNGKPSEKTIAEALKDLSRDGGPLKVTSTSTGVKAAAGTDLQIPVSYIVNPPARIGDILLDVYVSSENISYINIWEITGFSTDTVSIRGICSVKAGGGSASIADRAIADGDGNDISATYARISALTSGETAVKCATHYSDGDGTVVSIGAINENANRAMAIAEEAKASLNSKASTEEAERLSRDIADLYSSMISKSDLDSYSLKTESGSSVSLEWAPSIDGVNPYKLNIVLKSSDGDTISTAQIDFPLEQMVVNAEYVDATGTLVLETLNGTVDVPVSDIFKGLITESNIGEQTVARANLAEKSKCDQQGRNIVQTYVTYSDIAEGAVAVKRAEGALYADYCRNSDGSTISISGLATKVEAAEAVAGEAKSLSSDADIRAISSAKCVYTPSPYSGSVGSIALLLKTKGGEIPVEGFQEALMSLLEDYMQ